MTSSSKKARPFLCIEPLACTWNKPLTAELLLHERIYIRFSQQLSCYRHIIVTHKHFSPVCKVLWCLISFARCKQVRIEEDEVLPYLEVAPAGGVSSVWAFKTSEVMLIV